MIKFVKDEYVNVLHCEHRLKIDATALAAKDQPRPQAQPLPLRGYCVENTVGNARSGLAENAEKSV